MGIEWRSGTKCFFAFEGAEELLNQVTHLVVVAHQDDIEFMCSHPILDCLNNSDNKLLGVVCTDGRSSSRGGRFSELSDDQMVQLRQSEQIQAAQKGKYFGVIQLPFRSQDIRNSIEQNESLGFDLTKILDCCEADYLFTHNPFDKHLTHLTVLQTLLVSVRSARKQPKKLLGGEVWRSLDWLPEELKLRVSLDDKEGFLMELMGLFQSQVEGAKNYPQAVLGRKRSNATFSESHQADKSSLDEFYLVMDELMNPDASLEKFCSQIISNFSQEIRSNLEGAVPWK